MLKKIKNLVVQEEGQALTEYGLIIALVAVLIAGALITFKGKIADVFTTISNYLDGTTKS
ncbi:Flp family type IVb pilin [Neobacillus drentensis]|uniref:Flp family type IVb pilin n=1 Tax=Neobacillus drentensis TaxID=220684 RepID=UPI002FFE6AB5